MGETRIGGESGVTGPLDIGQRALKPKKDKPTEVAQEAISADPQSSPGAVSAKPIRAEPGMPKHEPAHSIAEHTGAVVGERLQGLSRHETGGAPGSRVLEEEESVSGLREIGVEEGAEDEMEFDLLDVKIDIDSSKSAKIPPDASLARESSSQDENVGEDPKAGPEGPTDIDLSFHTVTRNEVSELSPAPTPSKTSSLEDQLSIDAEAKDFQEIDQFFEEVESQLKEMSPWLVKGALKELEDEIQTKGPDSQIRLYSLAKLQKLQRNLWIGKNFAQHGDTRVIIGDSKEDLKAADDEVAQHPDMPEEVKKRWFQYRAQNAIPIISASEAQHQSEDGRRLGKTLAGHFSSICRVIEKRRAGLQDKIGPSKQTPTRLAERLQRSPIEKGTPQPIIDQKKQPSIQQKTERRNIAHIEEIVKEERNKRVEKEEDFEAGLQKKHQKVIQKRKKELTEERIQTEEERLQSEENEKSLGSMTNGT